MRGDIFDVRDGHGNGVASVRDTSNQGDMRRFDVLTSNGELGHVTIIASDVDDGGTVDGFHVMSSFSTSIGGCMLTISGGGTCHVLASDESGDDAPCCVDVTTMEASDDVTPYMREALSGATTAPPFRTDAERDALMDAELSALVIDASVMLASSSDVVRAARKHWRDAAWHGCEHCDVRVPDSWNEAPRMQSRS